MPPRRRRPGLTAAERAERRREGLALEEWLVYHTRQARGPASSAAQRGQGWVEWVGRARGWVWQGRGARSAPARR